MTSVALSFFHFPFLLPILFARLRSRSHMSHDIYASRLYYPPCMLIETFRLPLLVTHKDSTPKSPNSVLPLRTDGPLHSFLKVEPSGTFVPCHLQLSPFCFHRRAVAWLHFPYSPGTAQRFLWTPIFLARTFVSPLLVSPI